MPGVQAGRDGRLILPGDRRHEEALLPDTARSLQGHEPGTETAGRQTDHPRLRAAALQFENVDPQCRQAAVGRGHHDQYRAPAAYLHPQC